VCEAAQEVFMVILKPSTSILQNGPDKPIFVKRAHLVDEETACMLIVGDRLKSQPLPAIQRSKLGGSG
ncbi:MAG: hypothetical protein V3T19_09560, partial [Acidiferrobacterales bacterium]